MPSINDTKLNNSFASKFNKIAHRPNHSRPSLVIELDREEEDDEAPLVYNDFEILPALDPSSKHEIHLENKEQLNLGHITHRNEQEANQLTTTLSPHHTGQVPSFQILPDYQNRMNNGSQYPFPLKKKKVKKGKKKYKRSKKPLQDPSLEKLGNPIFISKEGYRSNRHINNHISINP